MVPKSKSAPKPQKPMISQSVINEYAKLEASPRWAKNFEGAMTEIEPHMWAWLQQMCKVEISHLAREMPDAFEDPFIAAALRPMQLRFFLRGMYMGMRKYESRLEGLFQLVPLPVDSDQNTKKKPTGEPAGLTSALGEEIDPSDLDAD